MNNKKKILVCGFWIDHSKFSTIVSAIEERANIEDVIIVGMNDSNITNNTDAIKDIFSDKKITNINLEILDDHSRNRIIKDGYFLTNMKTDLNAKEKLRRGSKFTKPKKKRKK